MPKFNTKRRIMRSFKMSEISGVDVPAQEGAKIVLAKRAGTDEDQAIEFAKGVFTSILREKEIERDADRAFWEAFEDQWQINEAFKQALCDAYSDGEEVLREYLDRFAEMARDAANRIREIRKGDNLGKSLYFSAVADAANGLIDQEDHSMFKTKAELEAAIAKYLKDGGDADMVKNLRKGAVDHDALDLLTGDLAMTSEPVEKSADEVAELRRENSILKMSDQTRGYFDGLGEAEQGAFLAKSADEQQAEVDAANATDPVLYKSADGQEYRKSDGQKAADLAKRLDAMEGRLAKAEEGEANASFEKQAASEFQYLPREGTVEMLKAAEAITDADKKKKMLDAMRASNAQAKKAHKAIGTTAGHSGEEGEEGSAEDRLDKMAKDYAKANDMSFHKAYDAILDTEEGSALYSEMVGAQPAGADD